MRRYRYRKLLESLRERVVGPLTITLSGNQETGKSHTATLLCTVLADAGVSTTLEDNARWYTPKRGAAQVHVVVAPDVRPAEPRVYATLPQPKIAYRYSDASPDKSGQSIWRSSVGERFDSIVVRITTAELADERYHQQIALLRSRLISSRKAVTLEVFP